MPIHVPAQQVVVLEIKKAPESFDAPRLYGLPGQIEKQGSHYVLKTQGPQGRTERGLILLPGGEDPITTLTVRDDIPKQPWRQWQPTPVKPIAADGQGVMFDVTFRREAAPTELRDWRAQAGELEAGIRSEWYRSLPPSEPLHFPLTLDVSPAEVTYPLTDELSRQIGLGLLGNFCGAYIDNAFSEMQETWVDLGTGGESAFQGGKMTSAECTSEIRQLDPLAKDGGSAWWLETDFRLPFMYYAGGFEPAFDDHTILVIPLARQSDVKLARAWINGEPVDIREYAYPRNRKLGCYYVDLVGTAARNGGNRLTLFLSY